MNFKEISTCRNEIYGFSILWIMLFHAIAILHLSYGRFLDIPLRYGNMGCEVFLFCSGVCLYFSWQKKPDPLVFLKNRLIRIALPVYVLSLWYWVRRFLILKHDLSAFFGKATMMDFWISGDQQIWFVSLILVCYFLYPYIYEFLFRSRFATEAVRLFTLIGISVFLTFLIWLNAPELYDRVNIAITRFPVFFLGCYFGKWTYEKRELPKYFYVICIAVTAFLIIVLEKTEIHGIWSRYFYCAGGISVTFTLIFILKGLRLRFLNRFLAFFGKISLNLYIAHIIAIRLYRETPFNDDRHLRHYAVVLLLSIAAAWAAEQLIGWIRSRISGSTPAGRQPAP